MDILGIGPLEFLAILVIALIVLGPKDMVKAGRTLGRTLRAVVSSETWRVVQSASREIRNLPNRMMREAALEDLQKDLPDQKSISSQLGLDELSKSLKKDLDTDLSPWTTPPPTVGNPEQSSTGEEGVEQTIDPLAAWKRPAALPEQETVQESADQDKPDQESTEPDIKDIQPSGSEPDDQGSSPDQIEEPASQSSSSDMSS